MIAIPIILVSMLYLVLMGYIGPKITSWAYSRNGLDFATHDGSACFAWFTCIFLPLAAPVVLGVWLSKYEWEPRSERVSRKQAKEIKEAQHRQELARINAETLAIQEREAGIR